jgi:protein-S-isoprenylcysteine O-methyltransferase Ste14
MTRTHFLDHRLPPLVVAACVAACMYVGARLTPGFTAAFPWLNLVAWALALLGWILALVGVATFEKHKTTVNPFEPGRAARLVETGIYRRTRNPMYVGVTLMLAGYAAYLGNPLALILVLLFPTYIQRFQIAPEERALEQLFGEAYAAYKTRVPRWL